MSEARAQQCPEVAWLELLRERLKVNNKRLLLMRELSAQLTEGEMLTANQIFVVGSKLYSKGIFFDFEIR